MLPKHRIYRSINVVKLFAFPNRHGVFIGFILDRDVCLFFWTFHDVTRKTVDGTVRRTWCVVLVTEHNARGVQWEAERIRG